MDAQHSHDPESIPATLYDSLQGITVATITLNGYTIRSGGPLHERGSMRSFKLTDGSLDELWSYWNTQALMMLRLEGTDMSIRISALPADEEGSGFLEFVALLKK